MSKEEMNLYIVNAVESSKKKRRELNREQLPNGNLEGCIVPNQNGVTFIKNGILKLTMSIIRSFIRIDFHLSRSMIEIKKSKTNENMFDFFGDIIFFRALDMNEFQQSMRKTKKKNYIIRTTIQYTF